MIDELTRDTASIDYVGGKYYVYENYQIVRELYAGGKKRLEEVSYIPEDKVGGAKPLDSFLAGTQYEFIEWVSPQGAVKNWRSEAGSVLSQMWLNMLRRRKVRVRLIRLLQRVRVKVRNWYLQRRLLAQIWKRKYWKDNVKFQKYFNRWTFLKYKQR